MAARKVPGRRLCRFGGKTGERIRRETAEEDELIGSLQPVCSDGSEGGMFVLINGKQMKIILVSQCREMKSV